MISIPIISYDAVDYVSNFIRCIFQLLEWKMLLRLIKWRWISMPFVGLERKVKNKENIDLDIWDSLLGKIGISVTIFAAPNKHFAPIGGKNRESNVNSFYSFRLEPRSWCNCKIWIYAICPNWAAKCFERASRLRVQMVICMTRLTQIRWCCGALRFLAFKLCCCFCVAH